MLVDAKIAAPQADRAPASPLWPIENVTRNVLSFTHAIDLAAPPDRVWPWLVQMGAERAGWYSWDLLDNGDCPSPRPVQDPELGSVVVEVAEAGGLFRHYERRAA